MLPPNALQGTVADGEIELTDEAARAEGGQGFYVVRQVVLRWSEEFLGIADGELEKVPASPKDRVAESDGTICGR